MQSNGAYCLQVSCYFGRREPVM